MIRREATTTCLVCVYVSVSLTDPTDFKNHFFKRCKYEFFEEEAVGVYTL